MSKVSSYLSDFTFIIFSTFLLLPPNDNHTWIFSLTFLLFDHFFINLSTKRILISSQHSSSRIINTTSNTVHSQFLSFYCSNYLHLFTAFMHPLKHIHTYSTSSSVSFVCNGNVIKL